jgi:hypothetical protein
MLIIQTNQVIIANVTEYHSYRERPEYRIVHNCTGYGGPDGANYEHDNTGGMMNYSGCYDMILSAISEHEGWSESYDY